MDRINQIIASIGRFVCHWDVLRLLGEACHDSVFVGYAVIVTLMAIHTLYLMMPPNLRTAKHFGPERRSGTDRRVANHTVAVDRRIADRRSRR
jgi:hypothetical protein